MKFVEDPCVKFGTPAGPTPDSVVMRGMLARMMTPLSGPPSNDIKPVLITERRFPSIHVRGYHATIDGKLWVSPGYMTMSLLQYARLWVRAAWRLWREPVPRAWVIGK